MSRKRELADYLDDILTSVADVEVFVRYRKYFSVT